jgi:hypothetical protein
MVRRGAWKRIPHRYKGIGPEPAHQWLQKGWQITKYKKHHNTNIKDVFGMALLHPRAALLQNSSLEQLCFRVLILFGKIGVYIRK